MKVLKKLLSVLSLLVCVCWYSTTSAQEVQTSSVPQSEQYYLISIKELESLQKNLIIAQKTNEQLQTEYKRQKMELTTCRQELTAMKKQCEDLKSQLKQAKTYSQLNEKQLNDANKLLQQYKAEVNSTIQVMSKREKKLTRQRDILGGIGLTLLTGLVVQATTNRR